MSWPPGARARAVAAAALLATVGCRRHEPPRPANLLLVTIDTLRADHCSVYGYSRATTPVLAQLAAGGALVDQAYAPIATTGPSHATIFTSLYPLSHGFVRNGQKLADEHVTLAERLRGAGYRTAAFVSSLVVMQKFGFGQGFGTFNARFDALGSKTRLQEWEGVDVSRRAFDRRGDRTTDAALDWLRTRQKDRPFFLWVHYYDPHSPYIPPAPFDRRFPPAAPGGLEAAISAYDGEIAFADQEVGRLLAALDAEGVRGETLVTVTADHGEGLMQHGHMTHGVHIYEEAVRVPLVFSWPGRIPAGTRLPGPTEHVDIAPTVLQMLGVPWGEGEPQGQSLAAALGGATGVPGRDPKRAVFLQRRLYEERMVAETEVKGTKFGVRSGPWKYIEAADEGTRELYDLVRDPRETLNLAGRDPDDAQRLAGMITGWRARYDRGAMAPEDVTDETQEALKALGYVR